MVTSVKACNNAKAAPYVSCMALKTRLETENIDRKIEAARVGLWQGSMTGLGTKDEPVTK